MPLTVSTAVPDRPGQAAIRALAASIERADGAPPLSDQALAQLADVDAAHVRAFDGDDLVGYAQRAASSLEIAALPGWFDVLLDATLAPGVLVWTHGRRTGLIGALERRGFTRPRELHRLCRPLDTDHPLPADPPLPEGVVVRAFVPGGDDTAWLAVNAAAFAEHREQGRWTAANLQARTAEDWFDPSGFLLADRGGTLLGFHWTKVHPDGSGEVYVLGIAPAGQGIGLGKALLVRGLRHLATRGCPRVQLYVDGDNTGALGLYERLGFLAADRDVQWAAPS